MRVHVFFSEHSVDTKHTLYGLTKQQQYTTISCNNTAKYYTHMPHANQVPKLCPKKSNRLDIV